MLENKTILIIGDHHIIIWALQSFIKQTFPSITIYSSATFESGISVLEEKDISLVILDTDIAKGTAFEMISAIQAISSSSRILVYAEMDEDHALRCLIAGADGLISKQSPFEQSILKALPQLMHGKKYINPSTRQELVGAYLSPVSKGNGLRTSLTTAEQKITLLLINGKTTNEIATQLGIRAATASMHKMRIFKKMGVRSIIELYIKIQQITPELLVRLVSANPRRITHI